MSEMWPGNAGSGNADSEPSDDVESNTGDCQKNGSNIGRHDGHGSSTHAGAQAREFWRYVHYMLDTMDGRETLMWRSRL